MVAHPDSFPRLIWRETAPFHFDTPLGYFTRESKGPWTCRPPRFGIDANGALYWNSSLIVTPADAKGNKRNLNSSPVAGDANTSASASPDADADAGAKGDKRNSFSSPAADVADADELDAMLLGGYHNLAAHRVFGAAGIPVLQVWNETMMLWELHRNYTGGTECAHFCHPSAQLIWIYNLYELLRETGL